MMNTGHRKCPVCRAAITQKPLLNRPLMDIYPELNVVGSVGLDALLQWWPAPRPVPRERHETIIRHWYDGEIRSDARPHTPHTPQQHHTNARMDTRMDTRMNLETELCAAATNEFGATADRFNNDIVGGWTSSLDRITTIQNGLYDDSETWKWWETENENLAIPCEDQMLVGFVSLVNEWELSPFIIPPYITGDVIIKPGRRSYINASSAPALTNQIMRVEAAASQMSRRIHPNRGFHSEFANRDGFHTIAVYDRNDDIPSQNRAFETKQVTIASRGIWRHNQMYGVRWHIVS